MPKNGPFLDAVLERWQKRLALNPDDLETLGLELRGMAFTLADVWDENFLADVQKTLADAIASGASEREWVQSVQGVLERYGSEGLLPGAESMGEASYLDLVFNQNTINAFQAGRYAEQFHTKAMRSDPYWMFSAIEDERICDRCAALDGQVFAKDDPEARKFLPGIHIGCRCMAIDLDDKGLEEGGYEVGRGDAFVYTDDNGDVTDVQAPGFNTDRVRQLVPDIFKRIAG